MCAVFITRRSLIGLGGLAVLGAGGASVAMEYDALPGRTRAYDLLGLNGPSGEVPDVATGSITHGVLDDASWVVAMPPRAFSGEALPVVIALHGAGASASWVMDELGLPEFLAASEQQFAVAAIDGGTSYWHPRGGLEDAGDHVLSAFLPVLDSMGLDTQRPGFLGWSMGGYGALRLGSLLGPRSGPVCAVSPALWPSYAESAPGAFVDQADYDAHGLFHQPEVLEGLDVRVDCGRGDPFFHNVSDFVASTGIDFRVEPGGHDAGYWRRVLPSQLSWLGTRLEDR